MLREIAALIFSMGVTSSLRISGRRIPTAILITMGIVGLSTVLYAHLPASSTAFAVSRLQGDPLGANNFAIRRAINRRSSSVELGSAEVPIASKVSESVTSDAQARKLMEKRGLDVVVWGEQDRINVSYRVGSPIDTRSLAGLGPAVDLKIAVTTPVVGLSFEPALETTRFLGDLAFAARAKGPDRLLDLLAAAGVSAHWTSYSHRSLPLWQAANEYLIRALEEGAPADFSCADRLYNEAESFLRRGDNPDLKAGISNNRAVLRIGQSLFVDRVRLSREAYASLKLALESRKEPNLYRTPLPSTYVALENLARLKQRWSKRRKIR